MSDLLSQLGQALAGKYEVERELGRGGMATVYLARDLKHHRQVAVKVLKEDLAAVLGIERFLGEIRVTAHLQHPNLLPLFDSGDAAGRLFYVMPYVDGESLRSRLDREKQLPVSEAVRIAAAVASALDYAHRQGVIHRDLKPENILLHDGQPIVADFGIALAVSKAGGQRVTQTGLSLGTPQYMSPEQATGDRTLDARTDVYALGAVTYEMLTGDPPHAGNSAQAIIAKVMTEKPTPVRALRDTVPVHVEHAVERALAKVPADRWSSAREFVDALEGRIPVIGAGSAVPARQRRLPWVTTGVLAAACLALILRSRTELPLPNAPISRFAISSVGDDRARIESAAISPDGQMIAISARTDAGLAIWIRKLDEITPRRLQGSDGGASPFFSPDGRWVGFVGADGFVRKLPLEGGTPTTLAKMPAPAGILWATADTIVTGMLEQSRATGLSRLSASGSDAGVLTTPEGAMHHWPILTPDGRSVVYSSIGIGKKTAEISPGILSLSTGRSSTLTIPGTPVALPFGVRDNSLLYRDSAWAVWSVPVDFQSQKQIGPPVRLDPSSRLRDAADWRLARNGTLLYTRTGDSPALVLGVETTRPDTVVMHVTPFLTVPRYSPDGEAVSMLSFGLGTNPGVFVFDRSSRTITRLTTWRSDLPPVWSRDGTRVIAVRPETADTVAWWVWRDGRATPERFVSAASGWGIVECAPSPDGRLVAMELHRGDSRAIFVSPAGGGASDAKLVVENGRSPRWSADGHWIAYEADVGATSQIFAQRYPVGGRVQLTDGGATHPVWARNGTAIYYESGLDIARAELEATPGGLRVRRRERVWSGNRSSDRGDAQFTDYDVSPSGQLAVFGVAGTGRTEVVLELNWSSNVRQR